MILNDYNHTNKYQNELGPQEQKAWSIPFTKPT